MNKQKKYTYLFFSIILISITIIFLISALKEKETEYALQNEALTAYMMIEEIYTPEDYLAFVESVNSGNNYQNCEVSLQSDLDFFNYDNLDPIGTVGEEPIVFMGVFNGNGHTISGVKMDIPGGYAGLFANLGGIVKNLQITNSTFSGRVCGAVAADTVNAAVINCHVDAQVSGEIVGTIVGKQDGNLFNCVTTSEPIQGEYQKGKTDQCYQSDCMNLDELNGNLVHVSGYYEDTDLCCWENGGLSTEKADLLETLTAKLNVKGVELKLSGYYSKNKNSWCIALPATYGKEKVFLEAGTSKDGYQDFVGNSEEEIMIFTWENRYYPIEFLCVDNIATIYITLPEQKTLDHVHEDKYEEIPGILTLIDTNGDTSYAEIKGFYGHGNDSWKAEKKGYNLKLESRTDLLNMGANEDYALLAGYRNESLMSYVATTELVKELGFAYAPEFRLVNLYVAGEYAGVYFFVEKIEIDKNRIEIESVYENTKATNSIKLENFEFSSWTDEDGVSERYYYNVKNNPKDITGGYLLEADTQDYSEEDSRFVSERGLKFTLKRARYSSREQVNYIADYWQEFENALFSETGFNEKGRHYSEYIDMESFAMQWLCYELSQDISLGSSIYFYKESDITGDGLLHACFPWDVEHSYVKSRLSENMWLVGDRPFGVHWRQIYQHEDFRKELCKVWNEKFVPAIHKMIDDEPMEYESGLRNLAWYADYVVGIHYLENSRWDTMYLWNRCGEIRDFLEFRLDALSKHLNEK